MHWVATNNMVKVLQKEFDKQTIVDHAQHVIYWLFYEVGLEPKNINILLNDHHFGVTVQFQKYEFFFCHKFSKLQDIAYKDLLHCDVELFNDIEWELSCYPEGADAPEDILKNDAGTLTYLTKMYNHQMLAL